MANSNQHPEQDPAEGSRETIERDLARQDNPRRGGVSEERKGTTGDTRGDEAAEPSPE